MIGVSLVMFDGYFLNYFASVREGGITLISNAKLLFNAPFNVIGPAAGAASLPFFASLFQQNRAHDFSASVARSVSRLFAVGMIVSAWMIALGPWLMDLFRGGTLQPRRRRRDHAALRHPRRHARHLGGAGNLRPRLLRRQRHQNPRHHRHAHHRALRRPCTGLSSTLSASRGLAIASDIGIFVQTASLAILLHRKRLVSLAHLEFGELARALLAALLAYHRNRRRRALPAARLHPPQRHPHHRRRLPRLGRRRRPHPPCHRLQTSRPNPSPPLTFLN